MATLTYSEKFYGWRIVGAAFVLASSAGPRVLRSADLSSGGSRQQRLVAAAGVGSRHVHFLFGALVVARLPDFISATASGGHEGRVLALAVGISGWAVAAEPWQLFVAALFSGAGWVAMGAAAINAILAPWFIRRRPRLSRWL